MKAADASEKKTRSGRSAPRTDARSVGILGERVAARYLRLHGYRILERNYRSGHWELDLIAARFGTIVFVEVKTRTYSPGEIDLVPPPGNAVRSDKIRVTRRAARDYLASHPTSRKPRMDVIEVFLAPPDGKGKQKVLRIHHIPAAY